MKRTKYYEDKQKRPFNKGAGARSATGGSLKDHKGITLIALIITIIVMLILVAVTITVAVNGGLFNYVGRAAKETQNEINKEQELSGGKIQVGDDVYNSIDDYLNGIKAEVFSEIYKENTPITQGSYTAVIPKGFAVGTSEGINKIEDGIVIQDAQGNQFVWIPVNYTATGTLDSNGLDSGFLSVFYRSEWANNARTTGLDTTKYTEPYASGYTTPEGKTESEEYYEMMRSVQENKGFYIGRYEAGSTTPRTYYEADGTTYKANGTTEMVVKRDAYPYNNVAWGNTRSSDYTSDVDYYSKNQGKGALLLSKELYGKTEDAGKYGVTSTLCYSVQWDAMLDFIKEDKDVTNSTTWGNYYDNPWTITRTTAKYATYNLWELGAAEDWKPVSAGGIEKTPNKTILLTTGASDSFAAKNIFDVCGNVSELTNEYYIFSDTVGDRAYRGGNYMDCAGAYQRLAAIYEPVCNYIGFRPTLYIK